MNREKHDPTRTSPHLSLVGRNSETPIENPPSRTLTGQQIVAIVGFPVLTVLAVIVVFWLY